MRESLASSSHWNRSLLETWMLPRQRCTLLLVEEPRQSFRQPLLETLQGAASWSESTPSEEKQFRRREARMTLRPHVSSAAREKHGNTFNIKLQVNSSRLISSNVMNDTHIAIIIHCICNTYD